MQHWIFISILATGVLAVLFSLFLLHDSGTMVRANSYRNQFERLMQELDRLVTRANRLELLATDTKETVLLEHYHSAIKMIETLLSAIKKLSPHGNEVDILEAPFFLVGDINSRLGKIEAAMQKGRRGRPHNFSEAALPSSHSFIGCHFCSKPFETKGFGKVRVKIDKKNEDVTACYHCRKKLLSTRKARVLFFTENGVQVHWSLAKTWTPSPEYWNINREDVSKGSKTSHLRLSYSRDVSVGSKGPGID
jgi:hypothetical protein